MNRLSARAVVFVLCALSLSLAGCEKPDQKAERHLKKGDALFAQEDYLKARIEYKNAGRLFPTDARVFFGLGAVDEATGDFQNAFANFTHAQEQDPRFAPALLKLAQYFMAGNQHEQALKRINDVLALQPENAEAIALLAGVRLRQKDFAAAESEAKRARAIDPANVTATAVLTGLYTAKGETAAAAAALEEGLRDKSGDVSLLLLKATFYEKTNDLAKVEEAYRAIIALKPKEPRYPLVLAAVHAKAGDKDKAEALLRQTAEAFPQAREIRHQFVDFMAKERGIEAAEKEVEAMIAQGAHGNAPYIWLADLYIARQDIDRAAELLRKIVAHDDATPESLTAQASLARLHIVKGDKALAQKLADAILAKNAGHPDALFLRASMAFENGASESAVADLRAIIRDNPKTDKAYPLLSEALLSQGRVNLAIDTLAQMLEKHPQNLPVRVRLAQLYAAGGNPAQGLAHLALVTTAAEHYPIAWESTVRLAIASQKWDLADKAMAKLATFDGYAPTASFFRSQIAAAQGREAEAKEGFKALLIATPQTPLAGHALAALAEIHAKNKEFEKLASLLEGLPVKTPAILTELGDALMRAGKSDSAAAAFDRAIAEGARDPKAFLGRAALLANAGKIDEAMAVTEKGAALHPSNVALPLSLAGLHAKKGQHDEEIAVYEEILKRNPSVRLAANNMAQTIADAYPNDATALEKARFAAEPFISSANPLLLDTLAWVYYRQGKFDQALAIMDRAMAAPTPLPPQMHYHHGALLSRMGMKARAREALEKATASNTPPYTGLEEARAMIATLSAP